MLVSKKFDKSLISISCFVLLLLLLLYTIAINSFKKGKFTCNKYLLNTYLYIMLTFNILIIINLTLEHNKVVLPLSLPMLIALLFINIGIIFLIHRIDPEKVVLKHMVWLLFVLIISLIVYPLYVNSSKQVVISALFTTLFLTFVLSAVAYIKPEWISLSWGPILFFALLAVIIMELLLIFLFRNNLGARSGLFRGISYVVILIFMGFILYDTKRLQINAKECVKADYIKESLKLFLDILNIFVRLVGLGRR
jgi:FtsH-binding integral membrane protein